MATSAITIPNSTCHHNIGKYQLIDIFWSIENAKIKPKIPEIKKLISSIKFQKRLCLINSIFLNLTNATLPK